MEHFVEIFIKQRAILWLAYICSWWPRKWKHEGRDSIAKALEFRLSGTNLSLYNHVCILGLHQLLVGSHIIAVRSLSLTIYIYSLCARFFSYKTYDVFLTGYEQVRKMWFITVRYLCLGPSLIRSGSEKRTLRGKVVSFCNGHRYDICPKLFHPTVYDSDQSPMSMGLLSDTQNCGLRMRRECRERFPRHRGLAIPTCITARAWRTCRDACRDR